MAADPKAGASCPTCCDTYTPSLRKRVACPYCPYAACAACVRRFLLSTAADPHCMSCRREWSPEFIDATLTRSFRDGPLKKHREGVLLDRERSMLPATQPYVERVLKEREIRQGIARLVQQRQKLALAISREERRLHRLALGHDPDAPLAAPGAAPDQQQQQQQQQHARHFVRPCPAAECRGFLSTQYRCGLCRTRVCRDCHGVVVTAAQAQAAAAHGAPAAQAQAAVARLLAEHRCDPADVASVQAIARDSKPCPRCGAMIHRVSGCSQMYCTAPGCQTAFDWDTGREVTGRIHNPHYYEFVRAAGAGGAGRRELDDIPCGGMPTLDRFLAAMRAAHAPPGTPAAAAERAPLPAEVVARYADLLGAHRMAVHVEDVELRTRWRDAAAGGDAFAANRDLRTSFLLGDLGADDFKKELHKREKRARKVHAVAQVLAMVANVAADTYRGLVLAGCRPPRALDEAQEQMRALREYANASLAAVAARFASTRVPRITADWSV